MYVIKKTVYQGADGVLVDKLSDVVVPFNKRHEAIETAHGNGEVKKVLRPGNNVRGNQQWMKK